MSIWLLPTLLLTWLALQSSVALPFATVLVVILMWSLVTFPLTVFGAMRGRAAAAKYDPPCKPNRVPREIPSMPLYDTLTLVAFSPQP